MVFRRHSRISSINTESWKAKEEWEDGLGSWIADLPTFLSLQGGTQIGNEKGVGQGTKGIIDSHYEIRGASWFTRVGEVEKSRGSYSSCKEMWTKC